MNRNTVIVDGTKPGRRAATTPRDQNFGGATKEGPTGLNGLDGLEGRRRRRSRT